MVFGRPQLLPSGTASRRRDSSASTTQGVPRRRQICASCSGRSVWNNIRLAIYLTVGVVLIAVPLATAMNAASQRAGALFRTTLLLPMVTAGIAVFYAWTALLGAGRPGRHRLRRDRDRRPRPEGGWISDPKLALIGLAVVDDLVERPVRDALLPVGPAEHRRQRLPRRRGSTAPTASSSCARITWPLLHPITLIVVTLNVVYAMQSYEMVYLMTNGGPTYATNTVGLLGCNLAFGVIGGGSSQYGAAAAITWCLVLGLALGFGSVRVLRALVRQGRR